MKPDLNRSDWLQNLWSYIRSIEDRIIKLEKRVKALEKAHRGEDHKPISGHFVKFDDRKK